MDHDVRAQSETHVVIPVYLIPGLGADTRIFQRLRLPEGFELRLLAWPPINNCKSLADYARCFLDQIDVARPYLIGGVSLGGMLSIEIAKISNPVGVVLISTAKTTDEFPSLFRFLRRTGSYRFFSGRILKAIGNFANRFTPVSAVGRKLFLQMLYKTPDTLLVFCAKAAITWNNDWLPANYFHLHGTIDRVFPIKNLHSTINITAGSHFMVFEKAGEVNELLKKHLPLLIQDIS